MQFEPAFDEAMWESRMLSWAEAGEVVDDTDLAVELDPELGLSPADLAAVRELWQTVVEEWEAAAADPWDSLAAKRPSGEAPVPPRQRAARGEWEPRPDAGHPVVGLLASAEKLLAEAAEFAPATWPITTKSEALLTLSRLSARADALATTILRESKDLADREAFRDPARWWAVRTKTDNGPARRMMHLGRSLEALPILAAAFAEGRANAAQTHVIVAALEELPDDLDPDTLAKAEAHLVGLADTWGPRELRRLGRHVLTVVAPAVAEEHERNTLEREDELAEKALSVTRRRGRVAGTTQISITCPDTVAHRFFTYLQAYTNPRQPDGLFGNSSPGSGLPGVKTGPWGGSLDHARLTMDHRYGLAFRQLLEALDPQRLPIHGGAATTLMVTMTLKDLLSDLGAADIIGTSDQLSPGEARRLACTADLIPVVMGSKSQPIDYGATTRLYTPGQRKLLALRDRTCRAENCDIPAAWCEAHHLIPWSRQKRTDLKDGILLCHKHHKLTHEPGVHTQRHPDGTLRFHTRQ